MSASTRRFSQWVFRANAGAVSSIRLLSAKPARHKGPACHAKVIGKRLTNHGNAVALTVRIPDDKGFLTYEVVTSNPNETTAKILAMTWL